MQLAPSEVWLFLGGIIVGMIGSLYGNYLIATYFRWRDHPAEKIKWVEFGIALFVFLVFLGYFVYQFGIIGSM